MGKQWFLALCRMPDTTIIDIPPPETSENHWKQWFPVDQSANVRKKPMEMTVIRNCAETIGKTTISVM